jgi:small-conductance mechanosensitive channel
MFARTQVWLTGFAGGKLDFDLVVWPTLESSRHPRTMHAAYIWAIYESLRAAGVQLADPRMDIHLIRSPEAVANLDKALSHARRSQADASAAAPNDAANAVYDDADRNRQQRAEEPRKRERPEV